MLEQINKPSSGNYKFISLLILGLGILLSGMFFMLAEYQYQRDLVVRTREVNDRNLNLALSLEQNVNRSFAQADSILQMIKADVESDGKIDATMASLLHGFLSPGIFNQIAVADSQGDLVYSAAPVSDSMNIAYREHFQSHVGQDSGTIHIAAPFVSRVTGSVAIFLSRRLNDGKGQFAGIVSIGIAPEYFARAIAQLQPGTSDSFVLIKADGTFLTRFPGATSEQFREVIRTHPALERVKQGDTFGVYESRGLAEGFIRVGAFRKLADYPVVVMAGISKEEAFRPVNTRRRDYRNWAGLVSTVLALTLLSLWLQVRKQYKAEQALWTANENLESRVAARTYELDAANASLKLRNIEISRMNEKITSLNENLAAMNVELEQRVIHRTADLTEAHRQLAEQYQEFRETRAELQERETSFFDLVNNLSDGVALANADGLICYANQAFSDMVQVSGHEQLTGRSYIDFVHPEDRAGSLDRIDIHRVDGPLQWREHRLVGVHGRIVDVVSNRLSMMRGGQPCVAGVFHDITERKRAEEKLREANAYLENLLNYANAPIIVWDPEFRITRFNRAFEFLTGRNEAEVLGQTLEILFPPALVEQSMALIRKTLTGERWETVEIAIQHRDESIRTVIWNSATLFAPDSRTPIATIAQGQDITKRKQAEDSLRSSQAQLTRDVEFARRVQQGLLPDVPVSPFAFVRTLYYPVNIVGGDFFHLEWRNEGTLLRGFLIDVSGHGLATAIQTSAINVLLQEAATARLPLMDQLRQVNARVEKYFTDGAFAAIIGFELDLALKELRYVGAGITRFYANGKKVATPGMFVGMWQDAEFVAGVLPVSPGDVFHFLTDGFTDVLDQANSDGLWSPDGKNFEADVTALAQLATAGGLRDDATAVCIKVKKCCE